MTKPSINPARRGGYSLLELVLAIALVGGTLAPAMALLRDGVELSRKIDERQLLANYAVQKLEERMAIVAGGWTSPHSGSNAGSLILEGFPSIYFDVSWSDQAAAGGVPDQLMQIVSTTHFDTNGNGAQDTSEPTCTFLTKIAKTATYADKATP